MERESLVVHWDLEQLSACHEGMELAQNFLIECGAAVCNLSESDPQDQRFDFLCKYSALIRHRTSCLECNEARASPQNSGPVGLMKSRDAVISFNCSRPDFVQVSETTVMGRSIHHPKVQRHPDVVAEVEERYIFFAGQAGIARRQVRLGHSCVFNV